MNTFSNRVHFAVAFPNVPGSVDDVWQCILAFLANVDAYPKWFEVQQIAGHGDRFKSEEYLKMSPEEVTSLIKERALDGFWVHTGRSSERLEFSLLHAKNKGGQSQLRCGVENDAKTPNDWKILIESLMDRFPAIGGWQWRMHYQSWQWNSVVELGYQKSFGDIPSGFRRKHVPSIDGIGPGRTLIDISLNPGRPRLLIPTIEFYPTAEMWLGPHFWPYAKCTKQEALAADFWLETRDTPHYTYFKCWPTAFTRPDGEQGRMQQRLWRLFFHEDCEWPPGSGSICDEPMYGPPELMPQPAAAAS